MKKITFKRLKHQAGVTILEFIAFIGLAALVIAGALGLYQSANSGAQSQEMLQVAQGVTTSIRNYASGAGVATGFVAASMSIPTGWSQRTTTSIQKSGNTLAWTINAANDITLEANMKDDEYAKALTGKKIGNIQPTVAGARVTWSNIPF